MYLKFLVKRGSLVQEFGRFILGQTATHDQSQVYLQCTCHRLCYRKISTKLNFLSEAEEEFYAFS